MDLDARKHVHALVDQLPPVQLAALEGLLHSMLELVSRASAIAPVEDEEIGEEEEQAVARSKEWFRHNEGIPFEQVVAECGFTMDQILDYRPDDERDPAA